MPPDLKGSVKYSAMLEKLIYINVIARTEIVLGSEFLPIMPHREGDRVGGGASVKRYAGWSLN